MKKLFIHLIVITCITYFPNIQNNRGAHQNFEKNPYKEVLRSCFVSVA